jgi:uncharacterized membrane protein YdcZ (DUF606 family)
VNAALRDDLDAPVTAGAFSFLVATAAMVLVLAAWQAATRAPRPHAPGTAMPWWGWAGGLVGAAYVTTIPLLIPEIGAATTIGLTVAGQQLASLAVDRWGLLRRRAPTADPRPPRGRRGAASRGRSPPGEVGGRRFARGFRALRTHSFAPGTQGLLARCR